MSRECFLFVPSYHLLSHQQILKRVNAVVVCHPPRGHSSDQQLTPCQLSSSCLINISSPIISSPLQNHRLIRNPHLFPWSFFASIVAPALISGRNARRKWRWTLSKSKIKNWSKRIWSASGRCDLSSTSRCSAWDAPVRFEFLFLLSVTLFAFFFTTRFFHSSGLVCPLL